MSSPSSARSTSPSTVMTCMCEPTALPLSVQPVVKATRLDFQLEGTTCVLVDDVMYTGRTARAAIETLFSYGRPARVQLACIADRGHRELPDSTRLRWQEPADLHVTSGSRCSSSKSTRSTASILVKDGGRQCLRMPPRFGRYCADELLPPSRSGSAPPDLDRRARARRRRAHPWARTHLLAFARS